MIATNFEKKSTPLGLRTAFKGQMNETESLVAWEVAPLQRFVEPFNQRQTQKGHKKGAQIKKRAVAPWSNGLKKGD